MDSNKLENKNIFEEEEDEMEDEPDDEELEDESEDDDEDSDRDQENKMDEHTSVTKMDDEQFQSKLAELESLIAQNKFQYQYYVDIIKLTRDNGELTKLREYRDKMSQIYPLTETLWLEWIKDEKKFMDNDGDRVSINELFQRAVQDYLSVDIWLEYIQFSIGGMGETNGIENVRAICENAIKLAGLHFTKGCSLWEVYREFETALLAGYQQSYAGSVQTEQQTAQLNKQIEKINRIFRLQLGVCLNSLSNSLEEFKEFDESFANSEQIKQIYQQTERKLKEIESFETALLTANDDAVKKLEAYNKYLDFELKLIRGLFEKLKTNRSSNKESEQKLAEFNYHRQRLRCLFERAIADNSNCLDTSLWLKYILYLNEEETFDSSTENREYNLSAFKRSVRNIPWSSKLWVNYLLELEKTNSPEEFLKATYNEAMNSGLESSEDYLQLWHCYLDYLRRKLVTSNFENLSQEEKEAKMEEIREIFQKAINQIYDYFKLNGDPTFSLEKYWSMIEAKYFKNMDRARKIFNEMILAKSDIGKITSSIWVEFYDLERKYGDEKHQRKLLSRALLELTDNAEKEVVYDLIVKFEKLNGNIYQFSTVYTKYEHFRSLRAAEIAEKRAAAQSKKNASLVTSVNGKSNQKQPLLGNKPASGKGSAQESDAKPPIEKSNNLKRKMDSNGNKDNEKRDGDGFLIPSLPFNTVAADQQQPNAKKTKGTSSVTKQEFAPPVNASGSSILGLGNDKKFSQNTVFISNLKFDVDEKMVKKVFEKLPGFKELRLIKHWSGKTKGYGYVDFETTEQATHALKLDRTPVEGRPLFISKNEDKSIDLGLNKFKYAVNLEKNKLFVAGLPFSLDNKGLEEIFNAFGNLKEIRIVTYRNGKSKGIAYVDFEDEQSASKALIQTDGMLIGEHQISVSISNPPKRSNDDSSKPSKPPLTSSLGSGSVNSRRGADSTNLRSSSSSSSTGASSSFSGFLPRSQLVNRKKTLNLS